MAMAAVAMAVAEPLAAEEEARVAPAGPAVAMAGESSAGAVVPHIPRRSVGLGPRRQLHSDPCRGEARCRQPRGGEGVLGAA